MPDRSKKYRLWAMALLPVCHSAFAAVSLGGLANNLLSPTRGITQLMYGVSYVAGAGMLIMSLIQYKAHRDNPTQVRLGTPIAFFIFAWVFLLLPYIASHSSSSQYVEASQQVERQKADAVLNYNQNRGQPTQKSHQASAPSRANTLPAPPVEDKDWYQ